MKVTIKNENKSSEIKYPCLMESVSGMIVLFKEEMNGVVICSGQNSYPVGSPVFDMQTFTPFTGTVELSND